MRPIPSRWWLWGCCLATLVGLNAWERLKPDDQASEQRSDADIVRDRPSKPQAESASGSQHVSATNKVADMPPDTLSSTARDIFGKRIWQGVFQSAPEPIQVAPRPSAPPLPMSFLGKKWQDGTWEVYLARGDDILVARQGGTLMDRYDVVQIRPPLMTLRFRPLGQEQTLDIGE